MKIAYTRKRENFGGRFMKIRKKSLSFLGILLYIYSLTIPVHAKGYYIIDEALMAPASSYIWWTAGESIEEEEIVIEYPQFLGMDNIEVQKTINAKIQRTVSEKWKPFTESELPGGYCRYQVTFANENLISILFYMGRNVSAGQTTAKYWFSMNFSVETGEEKKLEDYIHIEEDLIETFLNQTDADLFDQERFLEMIHISGGEEALYLADSKETWIYSYYTSDGKIGLIFNQVLSTAEGQNLQLEASCSDLYKYLK